MIADTIRNFYHYTPILAGAVTGALAVTIPVFITGWCAGTASAMRRTEDIVRKSVPAQSPASIVMVPVDRLLQQKSDLMASADLVVEDGYITKSRNGRAGRPALLEDIAAADVVIERGEIVRPRPRNLERV